MTLTSKSNPVYPPGPRGLARIQTIQGIRKQPLDTLRQLAATYGDIVHVGLGPYHIYLLNNPDLLHEMLVQQADIMCKPGTLTWPIAEFLGNGLLISHGAYWKHQRRLIQPAFHHRQVHNYGRVMVESIQEHIGAWRDGEIYDVDHEFMKMTLRMVTRTLFDTDITDADSVAEAVKILQRISYHQGQAPIAIPTRLPLPDHRTKQRAIKMLDAVVMQIVRSGRESGAAGGDLLSMLLNATDMDNRPLNDRQIRDEVMTVLLAGHESTANAIGWMWYLLAQQTQVADKLSEELDRVLGGRTPGMDDLKQLPLTEMIVKEALRLYPPAWALPREAAWETTIGGYPVRKGSLLLAVPFVTQRDPRYFEEPDAFIPERFAGQAEKRLPNHVYMPFGAGPRFCIGNTFALLAMQMTLATIHQRFHLRLVPDQRIVLDPLLTLRPRYGIHMQAVACQGIRSGLLTS